MTNAEGGFTMRFVCILVPQVVALLAGCTSSINTPGGSGGPLSITPKQLYSGFNGATAFRIGAIAAGAQNVTWSLDDPSVADLQVMGAQVTLTMKKAGTANLIAGDGTNRAMAPLTVTAYTVQQHMD